MGWAKGNPTRATVGPPLGVAPRPPIRGHPWAIAVGWPNGHPSKATPGPTPGGGLEATLWYVAPSWPGLKAPRPPPGATQRPPSIGHPWPAPMGDLGAARQWLAPSMAMGQALGNAAKGNLGATLAVPPWGGPVGASQGHPNLGGPVSPLARATPGLNITSSQELLSYVVSPTMTRLTS